MACRGGKDSQRPLGLPPKQHSCVQYQYDLAGARMNSQTVWESGTLRQAEPERAPSSMRGVPRAAGKDDDTTEMCYSWRLAFGGKRFIRFVRTGLTPPSDWQ